MKKSFLPWILAVAAAVPAVAASAQDPAPLAPIAQSAIARLEFPTGAMRVQNKAQTAQFEEALRKLAANSQSVIGDVEVVLWASDRAREDFAQRMGRSGFRYLPQPTQTLEGGRMTMFAAAPNGNDREAYLGIWLEQSGSTLLAWTVTRAAGSPSLGASAAPALPSLPTAAAPADASRAGGFALPAGFTRMDQPAQQQAVAQNLDQMAAKFGLTGKADPTSVEIVAWPTGGAAARSGFERALEQAGWRRKDHEPMKAAEGEFRFFSAEGPRGRFFGIWVVQGDQTMLAWGKLNP